MTRKIAQLKMVSLAFLLALTTSGLASSAQGQPTAEHQALATEVGVWDAETKFWMAPDTPPMASKATETNTILGGMWLISEFKGDMGGMPFLGRGQFGYDPVAKKYIGTWIDSMSPYLSIMEGSMDESNKKLTMLSKGRDARTGEESLTKMVTTYIDEDHKTFEMFSLVEGEEDQWWKVMEIDYTRQK
ncbi:MAG: DUF1579 domain-containing protein [Planctomycetes bacterium]|nr:DUF1579 domain-containing protein [Planctomycetota bacterium]